MTKRLKISLYSLLVLLLGVTWVMNGYNDWWGGDVFNPAGEADALSRYGFHLKEVSSKIGINFVHKSPRLDSILAPIMPQIASLGASVAVADFNNDGWIDIYFTNSRKGTNNALYKNLGDGTFENVAAKVGVSALNKDGKGVSMGAVWGDYDNDGYLDLFVYRWGLPVLFHNDQGQGFTKVPHAKTDFPDWANANSAIWFDYDRDGYLDLFLGGYYRATINLWHLKSTEIMPESFQYAHNGGRNYLFHNNGDGTFTEVAKEIGLTGHRWTLAAGAADLNGDGWPDLVIANDYGVTQLFINQHGKYFRNISEQSEIGSVSESGMNVAFGDVFNEGEIGIYITNISQPGVLVQGNNLWIPRETDSQKLYYENLAENMDVALGGWSWGAQFGDLNNDGFVDLYVTNGFISAKKGESYWYDYAMVTGGNKHIIADAKNWPPFYERSLGGYQQDKIWLNDGAGRFHNVADAVGVTLRLDGRAVAFADLWNRGVLDVIVANQSGPVSIFKNTVARGRNWIGFKLIGTRSNRSAIGAQVVLYWDNQQQKQVITAGSGFSSESQRRVHFGLGKIDSVQKVVIYWPSGTKQTIESPQINQIHKIKEPK